MAHIIKETECFDLNDLMAALADALDLSTNVGVATHDNKTVYVSHVAFDDKTHVIRIGDKPFDVTKEIE